MPPARKDTVQNWQPSRLLRTFLLGLVAGAALLAAVVWLLKPEPVPTGPDPLRSAPGRFAWGNLPQAAFPIPPYAKHLAGVCIVIDPGHVGQRDPGGSWKRGPTGLREAEVNLRVAQYLREFLDACGADVHLTRSQDVCQDLPDSDDLSFRAAVANELQADLFLSIHHNGSSNPDANYTSLFYHRSPAHPLASLDAARHLLGGLQDALRLDQHLECALLNDRLLYKSGLRVLREARVPAVLTEASFHSNPQQEERLRNALYNRREAYGLFLGLARWAQGGLPRVQLLQPADGRAQPGEEVVVQLDDGLSARGGWGAETEKILPDSVCVRMDDQRLPCSLNSARRELRFRLPRGVCGALRINFTNIFGQHVLHPELLLDLTQ